NWRAELQEYRVREVYPRSAIIPFTGREDDRLSEIDRFDHAAAIEAYSQAIALRPHGAFAYAQRARAHSDSGAHQTALADARTAARNAPRNTVFQLKLAYLEALEGDGDAIDRIRQLYKEHRDLLWEFGDLKRVELKTYRQIAKLQGSKYRILLNSETLNGSVNI